MLSELECTLYTTGSNELRMNQVFFPPKAATSRFINVSYRFVNSKNKSLCRVDFLWAISGFLFIQPPSIFELTSLFFSYQANKLKDLVITLPGVCQSHVGGNTCSCLGKQNNNLNILTQQVRNIVLIIFLTIMVQFFSGLSFVSIPAREGVSERIHSI